MAASLAAYAGLTAVLALLLDEHQILNIALVYLLLTLVVSAVWGYWVGVAGAVVADLLVNFFFVPPLYRFTVQAPANVLALLEFLAVALFGASMLSLLRRQVRIAAARQAETAILLSVSRELAHAVSPRDAMDRLCGVVVRSLGSRGCSIIKDGPRWQVVGSSGGLSALPREEEAMAREAVRTGGIARIGASRRGGRAGAERRVGEAAVVLVPLAPSSPTRGVLRVRGAIVAPPMADVDQLLRVFADEAGVALDRAALAEEARQAEALRRADEFKTVLLSSVSHDLRSPLTAIKAAVSSLTDEEIDWSVEDRRSFLATIESQTDRLTTTVNNILEMSRLEGGAAHAVVEPIEAGPLLAEVELTTRAATVGRAVRIDASDSPWLRADYGLLSQALQNLVENAARYSRAGGAIMLGVERAGGRVILTVTDEGPGIPAEDLPHLFEKFYRGRQAGKTKGTGLGLAIVKAIVELCGGRVEVRSSDAGTQFRVDLPEAAEPRR